MPPRYLKMCLLTTGFNGRKQVLKGKNIVDVEPDRKEIIDSIRKQIEHAHYETQFLYGSGGSGEKIARILSKIVIYNTQKINYY